MARDRCGDCRHCGEGCYCEIWEKRVNPDAKACPEFEEK